MICLPMSNPSQIADDGAEALSSRHLSNFTQPHIDWKSVADRFALPDFEGPWAVLHVKSRQEKALAADLATLKIPHFLPIYTAVRFHGSRKAKVDVPMFPGYVFLRGDLEQAYKADRTRRVASIIRVTDPSRLSWELKNIAFAIMGGAELDPYPGVVPGVRVEIVAGPLRGLQGTVESRNHLHRVYLQVGILGVGASLEVDASAIELIEEFGKN